MRTGRQSLCSPEVDVYRSSRGAQIIEGAGDPLGWVGSETNPYPEVLTPSLAGPKRPPELIRLLR
jgi:hypothetical protein